MAFRFSGKRKVAAAVSAACIAAIPFLATRTEIRGEYRGIYVLRGNSPLDFRITDDVYQGEQQKLLFSVASPAAGSFFLPKSYADTQPVLTCDWNEKTGRGCVMNSYPNGAKLITCFGRYIDSGDAAPAGLFVGGDLPFDVKVGVRTAPNASGMSFFDGKRWDHIWCSVNEAILGDGPHPANIAPAGMKFLGSTVLKATDREVVLNSRHEVPLDHSTLLMERYAFFRAGDIHFVLVNKITNKGPAAADFSYVYGDEPWVGNYGSSRGDVGWLSDRIVYEEGPIDLNRYNYAGIFDYGNSLTGEGHAFTRAANFLEWLGPEKPASAFFSNKPGYYDEGKEPLTSDTRFIGVQWGPETLRPGESKTYIIAVGMAGHDPVSGFPFKPRVEMPDMSMVR